MDLTSPAEASEAKGQGSSRVGDTWSLEAIAVSGFRV